MLDIEITNPEFINREYDIPTFRLPVMESRLEKLNKKAFKLGCDEGVITVISESTVIVEGLVSAGFVTDRAHCSVHP